MQIWAAVSAISTAIMTAVVAISAIFALRQLREIAKTRSVEVIDLLFRTFHTDQARKDRQYIYSAQVPSYETATEETREQVDRVIDLYERIAFIATHGLVDRNVILEMYSGTYLTVWNCVRRYVEAKRRLSESVLG